MRRLAVVTETPDDLLTVVEAGARMRCSRATVFRLIRGGDLPSIKPGRERLLIRADVDAYLESLRST